MPVGMSLTLTLPDLSGVTSLLVSTSNLCLNYIRPDKSGPPITRIPAEVLREIFLFTLLSPNAPCDTILPTETYTPIISESSFVTPFTLSNVNRHWRAIINNTPAIWRSITILGPHSNLLYRTELWLERSRNYSLDIVVRQYDVTKESDATNKLMALFSVHKARWRSVNFNFHFGISTAIANAFMDLQHLPKSRLQDAFILSGDDDFADGHPGRNADSIYQALQGIPSLRKLTWKSSYITPHVRFGAQLQFLELESLICINELADNVARCPNLIYLSAQQIQASAPPERRKLPIALPNLVVLILTMFISPATSGGEGLSLVPFLDRFAVPRLAQLQLKNVTDHPDEADDDEVAPKPNTRTAVQKLLQRSNCHLKSLNVHILDASATEVQAWMNIKGVENVEMLCLSGAEIDNTVLEMLTREHRDPSERGRFPNLKQLGLSLCEESVDEGVLLRMLGSRFWTPVSLSVYPPAYSADDTDVDDPKRTRQELCTAHVWVRESTPNMVKYEKMINMCAERIEEWKQEGKELRFTVAR